MTPASTGALAPVRANRILIAVEHAENRRLLAHALDTKYEVVVPEPDDVLGGSFDLAVVDRGYLSRNYARIQERRTAEGAIFLPVLLVISRRYDDTVMKYLWKTVDEVVFTPVEKLELFVRVETLLRIRRMSLELNLRREDLEAFIHAMTHDLRAPLRTITGFAETLAEDQADRLDAQGRHQLHRLQAAADEMWRLTGVLVEFSRIGRKAITIRSVDLKEVLENCCRDLAEMIQSSGARLEMPEESVSVMADPSLLCTALVNVISNALKYVAPGVRPEVQVRTGLRSARVRIEVADNGIGIPPEDQQRIFLPFVRLHGVEEYAGVGLGLSAARKVVDLMGGAMGVSSEPAAGTTFWIELDRG